MQNMLLKVYKKVAEQSVVIVLGGTENAGVENAIRAKLQG